MEGDYCKMLNERCGTLWIYHHSVANLYLVCAHIRVCPWREDRMFEWQISNTNGVFLSSCGMKMSHTKDNRCFGELLAKSSNIFCCEPDDQAVVHTVIWVMRIK